MTVDNIPQGEPRAIPAKGVHKVVTEQIVSPREIATRNVFKVLTEEIISQGESPHSRARRSVVRPARSTDSTGSRP